MNYDDYKKEKTIKYEEFLKANNFINTNDEEFKKMPKIDFKSPTEEEKLMNSTPEKRVFKIERDPYTEKEFLYKKSSISFTPGLTVLVGCNGSGKSTLLNEVKNQLEKEDIPVIMFDNLRDGGSKSRSKAAFYGNFEFVAMSFGSSEGENIKLNIGVFAKKLGYFCLTKHKNSPEIWILLDAIDSGLSIDNVIEIKEELFKTILESKSENQKIFILISANEYELAHGEQCFDVQDGKYRQFKTYDSFRKFILKSREKRDLAAMNADYDE